MEITQLGFMLSSLVCFPRQFMCLLFFACSRFNRFYFFMILYDLFFNLCAEDAAITTAATWLASNRFTAIETWRQPTAAIDMISHDLVLNTNSLSPNELDFFQPTRIRFMVVILFALLLRRAKTSASGPALHSSPKTCCTLQAWFRHVLNSSCQIIHKCFSWFCVMFAHLRLPGSPLRVRQDSWFGSGSLLATLVSVTARFTLIVMTPATHAETFRVCIFHQVVNVIRVRWSPGWVKLRLYRAKHRPREVREPGTQRRIRWTRPLASAFQGWELVDAAKGSRTASSCL